MKTEKILHAETVIASGAVTRARFVTHAGAQASAVGAKVLGIAATDAADGSAVAVAAIGVAVVDAGGAIAIGDDVVTDASGKAIVSPAADDEYIAGHARTAGAAGGQVEVLIR